MSFHSLYSLSFAIAYVLFSISTPLLCQISKSWEHRQRQKANLNTQKKEALMDENLPEEYRIELAKAFVNDLFSKVGQDADPGVWYFGEQNCGGGGLHIDTEHQALP